MPAMPLAYHKRGGMYKYPQGLDHIRLIYSGSGGSIRISGGNAAGLSKSDGRNNGGDIQIVSGSSVKGVSGSVLIQSGFSVDSSTGEIGETTTNCQ